MVGRGRSQAEARGWETAAGRTFLASKGLCFSSLQDLVAWVTASFLHIPHAEDIPNTVTVGNSVGFLLQPYNFFDEDPSIFSPGNIYFERDEDAGLCSVNPVACTPQLAACIPNLPSFSYEGL